MVRIPYIFSVTILALLNIFLAHRHPDKSDNPQAETKFVEIKQAYELLADTDRRRNYDLHGITSEDSSLYRERADYSQYGRFANDPFEEFFGSQRFNFQDQDISLFHKLSVTTRYYEANITPKSFQTPHLIFIYSDWCFACMKAATSFKKLMDTLEPVGIAFAALNAGHEHQLIRKIGVHSLPTVVLVLDGHNYIYKDTAYSTQKIVGKCNQIIISNCK